MENSTALQHTQNDIRRWQGQHLNRQALSDCTVGVCEDTLIMIYGLQDLPLRYEQS